MKDVVPSFDCSFGLPVSVRERLLQYGLVAAARVLDGLLLSGLQPGAVFTERQACVLLSAYRIGRRSIMTALTTTLPDKEPLFVRVANPPDTPLNTAYAAIPAKTEKTKCNLVTGANRVKTFGRPASNYVLPELKVLADQLGVGIPTLHHGQKIQPTDLSSPTAYRQSLHRELIARRPGQYTRRWLADRLGISRWTCRRYETVMNIHVHPMYSTQIVSWVNLERLLPATANDIQLGTFLEVAGKRYPPLQCIALRLLENGKRVFFKRREANYYACAGVGIPTPQSGNTDDKIEMNQKSSCSHSPSSLNLVHEYTGKQSLKPQATDTEISVPQSISDHQNNQLFWLCPNCLKTCIQAEAPAKCSCHASVEWEQVPEFIWRNQAHLKHWWQRRWREKHPTAPQRMTPLVTKLKRRNSDASLDGLSVQADLLAQYVHQHICELSLQNARALIAHYGGKAVERCLQIVLGGKYVRSKAGFLVLLLRNEHMFYHRNLVKRGVGEAGIEGGADWLYRMQHSSYVDFLANADEFVLV